MAWIGLYRPDEAEIRSVATEFELHELPVQDAISAHQRPKMERYGDTLFVVLLPARYLDDVERGRVRRAARVRRPGFRHHHPAGRVTGPGPGPTPAGRQSPELLCLGPEAVLYAILDQVVDEYAPVVAGLENDIDEIEDQLFDGDPAVSRRIYELSREVIEFQRATHPLRDMLAGLEQGSTSTTSTSSCAGSCVTWPTTWNGWWNAAMRSGSCCRTR